MQKKHLTTRSSVLLTEETMRNTIKICNLQLNGIAKYVFKLKQANENVKRII